ncbi:hypothetical protein GII30_19450 [Gordonia amarae]|uniref:Uncharacterized protein n=2 Tax=Gordonia amarae TaxID=36821 RepID=G7GKK1_9ACTN|nr:hypothetical protein [Gordonia amarae]QHN18923.1 hypothetical protein GII35_19805 [Gordonia amarae]QHN23398.1 hypothetical protein GII34_19305 [Gordonia amarae]QHN32299.1 hypothetical protein GII32_19620 [Gordonia amarae]QHN41047.1 hypothetical protein GII30_19450 [Gordonia amarae]GAB04126.1 hypothetical protein GOAMR_12_00530 [Gordonia amarae NBRC 15530]
MSVLTAETVPMMPGPRRFLASIAADVSEAAVVIVVFPDCAVDDGTAEVVLDELESVLDDCRFCDVSGETFPVRILDTFGGHDEDVVTYDDWDTIIDWPNWHRHTVLVPAWEHPDTASIVARWPAQTHACSLPPGQIPTVLIATTLAELSRADIERLSSPDIRVRWWWGVFGRLDTELQLASQIAGTKEPDPVDVAAITEVAGWDLAAIEHLLDRWDRRTDGIGTAVAQWQARDDIVNHTHGQWKPSRGNSVPTAPPPSHEQHWRDGCIDRWGHHVRFSVAAIDDEEVNRRLWLAHNHSLIAYVEEERTRLEKIIRATVSDDDLELLADGGAGPIEIGSLLWLVYQTGIVLDGDDFQRLKSFRSLRNDLAHRTPVPDTRLSQIRAYLAFS